ncbi:MAG TPA: helix-turn-helix transcriptional regulator [Clostridia bacterium]|nr:helix-turn-helix transcriptional regulator [Clostridia bacterium]
MNRQSFRFNSIATLTLFSAWLISFPYEGRTLYAVFALRGIDPAYWVLGAIGAHLLGLVSCMWIARDFSRARRVMLASLAVCFAGNALFFLPYPALSLVALLVMSFFAGLFMCAWSYFFREFTPAGSRMGTAAAALAASALIMIAVNLCCTYVACELSLALCLLLLFSTFLFVRRTGAPQKGARVDALRPQGHAALQKPFATMCAFILVLTVNSGLMFQIILPAYGGVGLVADVYWAVPYIAAILIVSRLPKRINKGYVLYVAIAMLGFAFIAFAALDRSVWSYVAVNTLLLGACGINDLFWWTILGELLDFDRNPAKTFGIGLGANVAGVLLGKLLGTAPAFAASSGASALAGMAIVCVALVLLPPMHRQLSLVIRNNDFLLSLAVLPEEKQKEAVAEAPSVAGLSERENEIVLLLLKGYTYKLIASELYISESTVKTHIRSIYTKLDIHNRTELIQKINGEGAAL